MANTTIQIKKSSTPSAKPLDLANGELAINFADGKIFYKNTANFVVEFAGGGGNYFGTVNAAGTLLVADTTNDILTIEAGTNITITPDAVNDKITIAATAGSDPSTPLAFNKANAANVLAFNALPNTSGVTFAGNISFPAGVNTVAIGTTIAASIAKLDIRQSGARSLLYGLSDGGSILLDFNGTSSSYLDANSIYLRSGPNADNQERLKVDVNGTTANGNVYIRSHGTAQLIIEADTPNTNEFNQPKIYMNQDGGGTKVRFAYENGSNDFEIIHENAQNITLGTNNTNRLSIDPSGNICIGDSFYTNYKLEVQGSFAATTKSFVIDHPTKSGMKLRYGSLEGPENGIYIRGRSKKMTIELPEYWEKLVDEDSITVNITPIDRKQDLFVKSVTSKKVVLGGGRKPDFFFTIFAERKDVEKLVVEYD